MLSSGALGVTDKKGVDLDEVIPPDVFLGFDLLDDDSS